MQTQLKTGTQQSQILEKPINTENKESYQSKARNYDSVQH